MHRLPARLLPAALTAFLALGAGAIPAQAPSQVLSFGGTLFDTQLAGATDFTAFAGGGALSAAVRGNGSVATWGWNPGEAPPLPPGTTYQSLAVGRTHVLALRSDGRVLAWGDNSSFQTDVPALPAGVVYTLVAASAESGAAARSDGVIAVWGRLALRGSGPVAPPGAPWIDLAITDDAWFGVRADGVLVGHGFPFGTLPTGNSFFQVRVGVGHGIVLRTDGTGVGWGSNTSGESTVPALPPGLRYLQVAAGGEAYTPRAAHSLLLRSDGQVIGIGDNQQGQLDVPPLPPGLVYTAVGCGSRHSLVRRSDGRVLCFGDDARGQCNAAWLPPGLDWRGIATSGYATVALRSDGELVGWGDRSTGSVPPPPRPPGTAWVQFDLGGQHGAGVLDNGTVVTWGSNLFGQRNVPALPGGVTYVEVATGSGHTLCRRSDGSVVAFGANHGGQCNVPALPAGVTWTALAAGFRHSLALRSDGMVAAFGDNAWGQCTVPALPPGLRYVAVAAGLEHSVALRSDGTAVGFGLSSESLVPPLPPGLVYVQIAANCARRSDGLVVAWGSDQQRQNAVPELPPGLGFVEVDGGSGVNVGRIGVSGSYRRIAEGCAGSRRVTRLVPRDTPRLGGTFAVRLFDLPLDAAFLITGLGRITSSWGPLPVSLAGVGAPGCFLQVQDDAVDLVLGGGMQAVWSVALPTAPALLGLPFHQQALVLDLPANALGAVMSAAMTGVVGGR